MVQLALSSSFGGFNKLFDDLRVFVVCIYYRCCCLLSGVLQEARGKLICAERGEKGHDDDDDKFR